MILIVIISIQKDEFKGANQAELVSQTNMLLFEAYPRMSSNTRKSM